MTTVSVPLPDEFLRQIEQLIADGIASNKADAIRKAVKKYLEDQAVEAVLKAMEEPSLDGDLDELASKI
ncbi:ribbon-helix-helix domain-containing protein [Patescibacteria group bacterium]|nr:ribbon-helix-helix domain-containing protein [Patescibacteria group bacterium]MBU1123013.1 ribbon-helix-helix domain-containing protein [Patescibacteria group bacterium]MBU1911737.1 ribbon-helix-helix domain-containing protein [Patescibacteria group bacterium]